jgi:hypothetical protein
VFPLNGKVPLGGSNGCLGASSDPNSVALWPRDVNVGIATGAGLVVLDIDYRHDGGDALAELEHRHRRLPPTVSAETGGGGEHLYFSTRTKVGCSVGKLGHGLDVRGDGGYVVGPPSIHPDTGRPYVWDNHPDEVELAPLPAWLLGLLVEQNAGKPRPVSEWRSLALEGVKAGGRNQGAARLAGHLLARGVDPYVALELVRSWNTCRNQPPLTDTEVQRTVESIAARELRKWRSHR